jgi:hypothetical protein
MNPRRGAREAEVLGQRNEVAKMPQLHTNPIVKSMRSIISMRIHHFRIAALLPKLGGGARPRAYAANRQKMEEARCPNTTRKS